MDSELPGNSHISRTKEPSGATKTQATSEPKTTSRAVISGKAVERPSTIGQRFKKMFVTDRDNDGSNFGERMVKEIVIPRLKDTALSVISQATDSFRQGVEEFLFGPDEAGRRRRSTSYGTGRPVVNYTRYSSTSSVRRDVRDATTRPPYASRSGSRRSNDVRQIIVETREDGDRVLEELDAIIDSDMGHATVGDYYALMDITPRSTDEEWGWTSLDRARIQKLSPNEFLIKMPEPQYLDV